PGDEVLPLDAARERLVLHPLLHRAGLEVQHTLARAHQRGGHDEPRQLVAGKQRLLERRVARDAGDLGRVRKDGANHPVRVSPLAKELSASVGGVAELWPALVIETVQQRSYAPVAFASANLARVSTYSRLDGHRVLQQAFTGRVLGQQLPGIIAIQSHV